MTKTTTTIIYTVIACIMLTVTMLAAAVVQPTAHHQRGLCDHIAIVAGQPMAWVTPCP